MPMRLIAFLAAVALTWLAISCARYSWAAAGLYGFFAILLWVGIFATLFAPKNPDTSGIFSDEK